MHKESLSELHPGLSSAFFLLNFIVRKETPVRLIERMNGSMILTNRTKV
jgi:hypothetical protein